MNIAEKFYEKKRMEQQEKEAKRIKRVENLANKIISALSDEETIESIENYLIEKGHVSITDFGCLCQDGFCSWQKGLNTMLLPLIQEWRDKGVIVHPSLSLDFRINVEAIPWNKNKITFKELRKMTFKELREWNRSYKQSIKK